MIMGRMNSWEGFEKLNISTSHGIKYQQATTNNHHKGSDNDR